MRLVQFSRIGICAFLTLGLLSVARAADLKVGAPAPPISVGKFVKGEPVKSFEPGKIYVMEFWATWCGPCVDAIPHISELQAKYKDKNLVVIGTSIWERDAAQAGVVPFVEKMGDKMNYVVAMDDRTGPGRGKMAEKWMKAAGRNSIPCSFIVDQSGKIAWIGHPNGLEKVLEQMFAGTFDAKAVAAVDELRSGFTTLWGEMKFAEAVKFANTRFGTVKENAELLNEIAWTIVSTPDVPNRDLKTAERFAKGAVDASNGELADVLDTLARVHFEKGQIDLAIEWQEKAVAKASAESKAEIEATLQKYKAAKK